MNEKIQQVLVAVAVLLLGWVGYTLVNVQQKQTEMSVKLDMVYEKTKEIVPRSENERRFETTEKASAANADRISKIEQHLINRR